MTTKTTTKGKNKKPFETTLGRAPVKINDDSIDLSHIRQPINTSIFGLRQVLQLFETATSEVRHYVAYECDIMYECRICRTIFRSLANFILHKRNYCRESYNSYDQSNCHKNSKENEIYISREEPDTSPASPSKENFGKVSPVPLTCESKQEAPVTKPASDSDSAKSYNTRERKNLNYVLRRLQDKQQSTLITDQCMKEDASDESKSSENDEKEKSTNLKKKEKCNISLEKISDSSSGVFQTMFHNLIEEQKGELMRTEVMEIHNILENNEAILGANGKVIVSSTEKTANFSCTVCNQKFSTKKTLTYHIKYKHNNTRLIYQCPECNDTFASAWSVFRHLYKIHRKTSVQVKKLRNQIHSNTIRRDQQPEPKTSSSSSSKAATEVVSDSQEKAEMENQWMEDLEGDNDLQRCGGCGRKFERKAALHSHSQFCAKRIALYNTIKENTTKKGTNPHEHDKAKASKVNSNNTIPENIVKGSRKRKQVISYRLCKMDDIEDDKEIKSDESNVNDIETSHKVDEAVEVNDESESETCVNEKNEESNENLKDFDKPSPQEDVVEEKITEHIPDHRPESSNSDNDDVIYVDTIKLSSSEVASINKNLKTKTDICSGLEKEPLIDVDAENGNDSKLVRIEPLNPGNNNKISPNPEDNKMSSESENTNTNTGQSSESEPESSKTHNSKFSESESECSKGHKRKSSESESENSKRAKSDSEISSKITLEMKSLQYVDKQKRCCLPCQKSFKSFKTLLKHMAAHFSWYRYQCRFCSFLSYSRSKCDRHVEVKHVIQDEEKLKNSVMHIPQWKTINNASEFKYCLKKHRKKNHNEQTESVEVDEQPESGHSDSNSSVGLGQEEVTQTSINNKETQEGILVEKPNVQDPSVRKMIMEVIFGNAEAKKPEEKEGNLSSNSEGSSRPSETEDFLGFQNTEASNNINSRPVRTRVPTVQKDFLYDMGQILKTGREDGSKKDKKVLKTYSKEKVKKSVNLGTKTAVLCNKSVQPISNINSVQDINMNTKNVKQFVGSGD